MDWTQIVLGLIGLGGICFQAYYSNKNKEDKDKREKRQSAQLNERTTDITKQIEANTELAKENKRLITENSELIAILTEKLAANDVATVSVVRNNLRDIYYKVRPFKMISDTDFRAVAELYNAYKAVTLPDGHHPNSWCDQLYEEMQTYKRVETYPNGMHHITTSPLPLPEEEKITN